MRQSRHVRFPLRCFLAVPYPQATGMTDRARARLTGKRGGGLEHVTLLGGEAAAESPSPIDVLALHESLSRMAAFSPRQERIVELRYFGGLTIEEAAEVIGISEATLVRE